MSLPAALPAATAAASAALVTPLAFRTAMRSWASGVCVVTVGQGHERTGLTATSLMPLSLEPPELLVSVNQNSSAFPVLMAQRRFGVSVLGLERRDVADRFAGAEGLRGEQRYQGADWLEAAPGISVLRDSVVGFACTVQQIWLHHSHAVVAGRVVALHAPQPEASPLLYWHGQYRQLEAAS